MKKKLSVCICALVLALSLVACGSNEEVTYGGHTEADFEYTLQNFMTSLSGLDESSIEQNIAYYESSDDTVTLGVLEDWSECYADAGMFVDFGEFSLDKSGKTLTATQVGNFTGGEYKLVFVFNANHVEDGPTAINIEKVYSLGQKMGKAALNTVMGILIVFCMLIVMSLIISLFKFIPAIEAKLSGKKEEPAKAAAAPAAQPAAVAANATDDLELVAVIAAAIAASTGASTDSFVVRSIRKRQ